MNALVRRNGPADPTPPTLVWLPDKGPTVLRVSCTARHGHPECMGAAGGGPSKCTCEPLSEEEHRFSERLAYELLEARDGEACPDCAFKKGSPEAEDGELEDLLEAGAPFRCHRGMPMDGRGMIEGREPDGYIPRRDGPEAPGYPVCRGWLKAKLARVYSEEDAA